MTRASFRLGRTGNTGAVKLRDRWGITDKNTWRRDR